MFDGAGEFIINQEPLTTFIEFQDFADRTQFVETIASLALLAMLGWALYHLLKSDAHSYTYEDLKNLDTEQQRRDPDLKSGSGELS